MHIYFIWSFLYFKRIEGLYFNFRELSPDELSGYIKSYRAVFTWLSKGIGFGFGFGFTTPFGWLVYLLWFWFYDSQVKTALKIQTRLLFFLNWESLVMDWDSWFFIKWVPGLTITICNKITGSTQILRGSPTSNKKLQDKASSQVVWKILPCT